MLEGRGRAESMRLLARVEAARESRCRSELQVAEAAWAAARACARAADADLVRTREHRSDVLRQNYAALPGLRSNLDIQALRLSEQMLAAQQQAAQEQRLAAEAAEDQARTVCERARGAFRLVSQRSLRRGRLADTLRRQAALASMVAEEEAVIDELMDRVGAGSIG